VCVRVVFLLGKEKRKKLCGHTVLPEVREPSLICSAVYPHLGILGEALLMYPLCVRLSVSSLRSSYVSHRLSCGTAGQGHPFTNYKAFPSVRKDVNEGGARRESTSFQTIARSPRGPNSPHSLVFGPLTHRRSPMAH